MKKTHAERLQIRETVAVLEGHLCNQRLTVDETGQWVTCGKPGWRVLNAVFPLSAVRPFRNPISFSPRCTRHGTSSGYFEDRSFGKIFRGCSQALILRRNDELYAEATAKYLAKGKAKAGETK